MEGGPQGRLAPASLAVVLRPMLVAVRMMVVGMPRVLRVVVLVDMVLGSACHVVMALPVRVDMRVLVACVLGVLRMPVLMLGVLGGHLVHDLALLFRWPGAGWLRKSPVVQVYTHVRG